MLPRRRDRPSQTNVKEEVEVDQKGEQDVRMLIGALAPSDSLRAIETLLLAAARLSHGRGVQLSDYQKWAIVAWLRAGE